MIKDGGHRLDFFEPLAGTPGWALNSGYLDKPKYPSVQSLWEESCVMLGVIVIN